MSKPVLANIPSAYKSSTLYSVLPTNGSGDFTFDRASSATRVNKDGLIETVSNNVPRLDYSDGSCPSLLLEPQRTNLYLNSENLSTQNVSVSSSTYIVSFYGTGSITFSGAYSGTLTGVGYNKRVFLEISTTAGTLISTVSGSVLNAQLEQGSYPTSYIPTVIRLADNCYGAGDSNLFDITEGTMYFELSKNGIEPISYSGLSLSDSSLSNRIELRYVPNSNTLQMVVRVSSAAVVILSYTISDVTEKHKVAITFKENDYAFWVNGSKVGTDTSGVLPSGLKELAFNDGVGANSFYGNVHDARVYNEVLSTTELATLTTL